MNNFVYISHVSVGSLFKNVRLLQNGFLCFSVCYWSLCISLIIVLSFRSVEITDSGVLAIAGGCLGLEMINVSYCKEITDGSLMSLAKCPKLRALECRGCPLVTSLGVAAIAVGCKQLTKLDIKKCCNVNDIGIIPLGHFSQNLRQVLMLMLVC